MSEIDVIRKKIAGTEEELSLASLTLKGLQDADEKNEIKIQQFTEEVRSLRNLLTEQLKKENLLVYEKNLLVEKDLLVVKQDPPRLSVEETLRAPRTCTWVLWSYSNGSHRIPVGTAISISTDTMDLALTAGHCIVAGSTHVLLSRAMAQSNKGETPVEPMFVARVVLQKEPDIAVLRLIRGEKFMLEDTVELMAESMYPWKRNYRTWKSTVQLYHCPIEEDLQMESPGKSGITECNVSLDMQISKKSDHHVEVPASLGQGSSGGGLISCVDGKLMGILVNSCSASTLTFSHMQKHNGEVRPVVAADAPIFTAQAKGGEKDAEIISVSSCGFTTQTTVAVLPATLMLKNGEKVGEGYSLSLYDWLLKGAQDMKGDKD